MLLASMIHAGEAQKLLLYQRRSVLTFLLWLVYRLLVKLLKIAGSHPASENWITSKLPGSLLAATFRPQKVPLEVGFEQHVLGVLAVCFLMG